MILIGDRVLNFQAQSNKGPNEYGASAVCDEKHGTQSGPCLGPLGATYAHDRTHAHTHTNNAFLQRLPLVNLFS